MRPATTGGTLSAAERAEVTVADLRNRIVERIPIEQHDGASGAELWRARLDDGTPVILKRFDPELDLTIRLAPDDAVREVVLWQAGVLDRLPPSIGHPVLDAWIEGDRWMLAMRDLSGAMLSYQSRITREECRRFLAAAVAMHDAFRGERLENLWPLEDRLTVFAPRVMRTVLESGNPLPQMTVSGWEHFADLAPAEIVDAVFAIHADPSRLTGALRAHSEQTLLHGDLWLPNAAFEPERVTLIDWALATLGVPMVEFTSFLVGCATQVEASREQLLDDIREEMGERHDELSMRVALICGVVEMGWNMGWHAARTPGPAAQEHLDWWVGAARDALGTGLLG